MLKLMNLHCITDIQSYHCSIRLNLWLMIEIRPILLFLIPHTKICMINAKENSMKPLGLTIEEHLDSVGFQPHNIAAITVSQVPPWKFSLLIVNFELSVLKKNFANPV